MALNDLTDRTAVRRAIADFDDLGRNAFLEKHGFCPSRAEVLRKNGKDFDSMTKSNFQAAIEYS